MELVSNMSTEPVQLEVVKPRIALALSGGGFRASIFHFGVLKRLAELGWLKRVDVLSTVSGGSIIGAFAVIRWQQWLEAGGDGVRLRPSHRTTLSGEIQKTKFHLLSGYSDRRFGPCAKLTNRQFTRTQAAVELIDQWFFGVSPAINFQSDLYWC